MGEPKSHLKPSNQFCIEQEDALVSYSQAQSLAIASKVSSWLPRELRDTIYEFCWSEPLPKLRGERERPWNDACPNEPDSCTCLDWKTTQIFVLPSFVGSDFAIEAAITHYKGVGRGYLEICPDELKNFLTVDHFHLNINPVEYRSRFVIVIPPRPNDRMGPAKFNSRVWEASADELLQNFEALRLIPRKQDLKLILVLAINWRDNAGIDLIMDLVGPVWLELEKAGAELEIIGPDMIVCGMENI